MMDKANKIAPAFTRDDKLNIEWRKDKVFKLRLQGLTYREISTFMRETYGDLLPTTYDERWISREVRGELDKLKLSIHENAKQYRALELERLDKLFQIAYNIAMEGNLKAIDRALNIMSRRAKMIGLDEPSEVKVHDWRSEILDLIKTGKITLSQVKDELGEELTAKLLESGDIIDSSFVFLDREKDYSLERENDDE